MSGSKKRFGLTRRGFLKATGAATATASLAGLSGCISQGSVGLAGTGSDEQVYQGACRGNCMGGCPLKLTVRDGKIVKVGPIDNNPRPEYARICQRGRSHVQTIYNEDRLKYPMRRIEGTDRGAGEWERISWDEAVDEICTKWLGYQQEYGPASIGISHASGCYGMAFGVYLYKGYLARLLNVMNAVNVAHCYDSTIGKFSQWTGFSGRDAPHVFADAKCIVLWGVNPTESVIHTWHFISEAQESGARIVCVDPNYTIAASKADLWVPLRPGTDGALALALFNLAVQRNLVDEEAIKRNSTLPFLIKDEGGSVFVSDLRALEEGEEDEEVVIDADGTWRKASEAADPIYTGISEIEGIKVTTEYDAILANNEKWTIEHASEVCGLSPELIEELFEAYTTYAPANTMIGLGIDHYANGFMSYVSMALLSLVTGNLTHPYGGMGQYDLPGLDFWANFGASMPLGPSTSPGVPFTMLKEVCETGKLGDVDVPLKSIFIAYHNPLSNQTERNAFLEALDNVELLVVSDYRMTETVGYADIVLPCAHWFEYKDVFFNYSPYLTLQEKAIDPLYESKSNYEIIQMLGKGLGLDEYFSQTEDEAIQEAMDSQALIACGLTYDRVMEEKVVPLLGYDGGTGISSADQRVNFYFAPGSRCVNSGGYGGYFEYGQEIDWDTNSLPMWEPPHEAWTVTVGEFEMNELAERFPLQYSSYRNKMRCHTQFGNNPWLLELFPEPTVMMNNEDMAARGISHADYVRVYNDRGFAVVRAVENNGIHPGMIVMPKGWQADQYVEGHASSLTSRYMNPASSNNNYFDALCEVELYEGSVS